MDKNPAFYKSLKLSNERRFKFFQPIILSHLPVSEGEKSKDEIIGMFYFDTKKSKFIFKQDYIVNIKKEDKEFVSYTRGSNSSQNKYVRSIHDFYSTYGKNGDITTKRMGLNTNITIKLLTPYQTLRS